MLITITYFVHGTTTDNERGLSTGQAQGKLSHLGLKQAKELSVLIKSQTFDLIFSSDLRRAIDSARLMFPKAPIIQDKRLRECDYGLLNQTSEERVIYEDHISKPFPRGERLIDVEKRVKEFIQYLKDRQKSQKLKSLNIAIVSHKAPQLALEVLLKKKTWKQAIEEDWRKTKSWQPGWEYCIE